MDTRDISGTILGLGLDHTKPKTLVIEFTNGDPTTFKRIPNVIGVHPHTYVGHEQPHELHVYVEGCDIPQQYVWLNIRGYQLL